MLVIFHILHQLIALGTLDNRLLNLLDDREIWCLRRVELLVTARACVFFIKPLSDAA